MDVSESSSEAPNRYLVAESHVDLVLICVASSTYRLFVKKLKAQMLPKDGEHLLEDSYCKWHSQLVKLESGRKVYLCHVSSTEMPSLLSQ